MSVIKQHEGKTLCTERAKCIPSWLSTASTSRASPLHAHTANWAPAGAKSSLKKEHRCAFCQQGVKSNQTEASKEVEQVFLETFKNNILF